ncbi:phytanoyl-CoA dioxygenase family protein [Sphingomonadaceae bacterium LXI357]|uniref:Phytanoyl-CoA dioxygenase family protein n=1 Tax=Stakelama marina TaxID=2826939 RepID=A0A8T4IBU0_9SPHN|nr:phytanoyl-CoA dioxygenase family protein [Stakelama marina]
MCAPSFLPPEEIEEFVKIFAAREAARPGERLEVKSVADRPQIARVTSLLRKYLGESARPVRVIAFDKHSQNNWFLSWHQDRTIEVKRRAEVEDYGPWTRKQGRLHVSPPFAVIERMLTVRMHVDAVDEANAPLLIAPGSHKAGVILETQISSVVDRCGVQTCLAEAGDIWIYSTPILHASKRAVGQRRRRVLQIDYAAFDLPAGLEWAADD